MGSDCRQQLNWLLETLYTDNDFRVFHRRIYTGYDNFSEDEKYKAMWLGVRSLRPMADELVNHLEGQLIKDEWINLGSGMRMVAKTGSNFEPAY